MSEGMKVPYADAKKVADDLLILLGDHFNRLEIAGSLRRKKEFIGDIELVGIPHPTLDEGSFFAVEISPTVAITNTMKTFGYKAVKTGEKYIKFVSSRMMNVDLFLCTRDTWGCVFMIRTGSAEFTRKMVTKKAAGGWCPDHLRFCDGRLWDGDDVLYTREEEDVFDELGLTYVPPEQRSL